MITQNFIIVWCDFIDDEAPARELNGLYFCDRCGSTDHDHDTDPEAQDE